MNKEQKNKNIKKSIIVILSVLLPVSIFALSETKAYTHIQKSNTDLISINDNSTTSEDTTGDERVETVIKLYNKNPKDNTPFKIKNMFPGDKETKYYGVQVSYEDEITVHFNAKIRDGYEKLAQVMKCEVVLLNTGETLYDGLMKDMPDSLQHSLSSDKATKDELYYKITSYLETSVGNEYQNKELIADFNWWVEEEENLVGSVQTGDNSNIILWFSIMSASLFIIILLSKKARKEEIYEQYK